MATRVGEAAIVIVPSLRGFKPEADRRLKEMRFEPIRVRLDPNLAEADAKMDEWRARQALNPVKVPIRGDFQSFQRDLSQVEHIFKRSSLSQAIRLNIKVVGLDALPALAYAAGSAASGLDALGNAALALPGMLAGAGVSVGALMIGLHGLKEAFQGASEDSKNAVENAKKQQDANRALERSYRDYKSAVRDTIREIQDLNAENRRSSLNVADALLSVQESANRLREGGFKNITEAQRAQLGYLESVAHFQDVMTKTQRTAQDAAEANAKGVAGADKVVNALEQIQANTARLNESQMSKFDEAMKNLSPNAQAAAQAFKSLSGAWKQLSDHVQDNMFAGLDKEITDLGQKLLPGLEVGLSRVASGINANFRSIGESLGNQKNGAFLERIFGNTDVALERLSHGMNPMIEGFTRLSSESSNFLPRMADGFDKVMDRFDAWTDKVSKDGSLDKWIGSGLKALDELGDSVIQVGGIFSSLAKAFDEASGHSGGFVKSLDDGLKGLNDLLKSDKGQTSLVHYFQQAHEFIEQILGAIRDMRPFLHDVTETAREWSAGLFEVVGGLMEAAEWIDKNTGLLKIFVDTYLVVKAARPVVDALTASWKNYATVVQAAAKWDVLSGLPGLQRASRNIEIFRGNLSKLTPDFESAEARFQRLSNVAFPALLQASSGAAAPLNNAATAAGTASSKVKSLGDSAEEANRKFPALAQLASNAIPPLNNASFAAGTASSQLKTLGEHAEGAGGKIGGAGKASTLSRIGALAGALAPGAAFMIAVPAAMWAIEQMGEAHKKAAEQAQVQKDALDRLKDSIDAVTGAAGKQAMAEVAKLDQNFMIPGLGGRNIFNDAGTLGLSPGQVLAAQNPVNQDQRNDALQKANAETQRRIGQSSQWREYGDVWQKHGISLETISLAANGNKDALNEVRRAEREMFGKDRDQLGPHEGQGRIWTHDAAPDLTNLIQNAGAYESVSTAIAISEGSHNLAQGGQLAIQANTALNGQGRFKDPGAANFFAQWGADNSHVHINNAGQAEILTDRKPNIPEDEGTVVQDGQQWKITLSPGATDKYIQKFADGGVVRGPGGPRDDNILVRTSAGEHVTNADAVKYYGVGLFNALNDKQIPKAATGGLFGLPLDFPPPAMPNPAPAPRPMGPFAPAAPAEPTWGGGPKLGPPTLGLPSSLAPADVPDPLPAPAPTPVPVPSHTGFDFGGAGTGGGSIGPGNGVKDPELAPSKLPLYATGPLWPGNPGKSYAPGFGQLDNWSDFGDLKPVPTTDVSKFGQWWQGADKPKGTTPGTPNQASTTGALGGPPRNNTIVDAPKSGNASFNSYLTARGSLSAKDRASFDEYWRGQGFNPEGGAVSVPKVGSPTGSPSVGAPIPAPRVTTSIVPQGTPVPRAPIYAVQPSPNGGAPVMGMSGPTSAAMQQFAQSVAGKVPYKWGGFGPDGMDCSGLALAFANIAAGRPPFEGGRNATAAGLAGFSTANEGQELAARGFVPGPGGPGTLTIGWSDSHTGVTLPDGTHIDAQGDATGIVAGPGSQGATGFPNVMHLPIPDSSALSGLMPGGMPPGFPRIGPPGLFNPGGLQGGPGGQGMAGLPQNLQPMNIAAQLGKIGLGFLAGFFGIDTSYLNDFDQVANFYLGKGLGGGQSGATGINGMVSGLFGDYQNGQAGLSPDAQNALMSSGFGLGMPSFGGLGGPGGGNNGPLDLGGGPGQNGTMVGASGLSMTPEQIDATYGPLITQICQAMGVDPAKWKGPLEAQINTESKGNPASFNMHDSDGHGGEQTVQGLFNFLGSTFESYKVPGFGSGQISDPVSQIAAAINYTKQRYGMTPDGAPLHIGTPGQGFATGGSPAAGLAWLSSGEFRSSPDAVAHYGPALFSALNSKQIPRSVANSFARGGYPFGIPRFEGGDFVPPIPLPILQQPQTPSGQQPGPLDLGKPAPAPTEAAAPPGPQAPDAPPPMPGGAPAGPMIATAPGTGGQPGPGATAPAPDPGSLPGVADAMNAIGGAAAGIGGGGSSGAMPQPGAESSDQQDPRATLGAAPTSNDHNLPALSQGIQGAASTIGSLAATAAQLAIDGGTMGVGAAGGGSAAAAGIQAGAQMAGQVATGAVNILSSLMVGTMTGGSTGSASGVPLLPQRQPMQAGGVQPIMQRVHNGDINVTNLDEFKRQQQLMDAQDAMPFIGKY